MKFKINYYNGIVKIKPLSLALCPLTFTISNINIFLEDKLSYNA